MATPSKRAATQRHFEEKFGVTTPEELQVWRSDLRALRLTLTDEQDLVECVEQDIIASYERSALTIMQALSDLHTGDRLWAAVKLYYSLFYALRVEMLLAGKVLVRAGNVMIIDAVRGAQFSQYNGPAKGDHGIIIALAKRFHSTTDILQTQTIDGQLSYEWIKGVREMVQYKLRRPPELDNVDPFFPDANWAIFDQINTFISEKDLYFCFDPDYAALALPLKRFQLTSQALRSRVLQPAQDFYALVSKYFSAGNPCNLLKPFI